MFKFIIKYYNNINQKRKSSKNKSGKKFTKIVSGKIKSTIPYTFETNIN